jgi:Putative lumazine-binding
MSIRTKTSQYTCTNPVVLVGAAIVLAAVIPSTRVVASGTAEVEIRTTLNHYATGLRDADLASLRSAFAETGQFVTVSQAGDIQAQPFGQVLPSWVRSPDPKVALIVIDVRLASPTMAAVTVKLRTGPACYDDQLLLVRRATDWQIVAKTTTSYPDCVGWTAQPMATGK